MKLVSGLKLFDRYAFNRTASRIKLEKIYTQLGKSALNVYEIAKLISTNHKTADSYMRFMKMNKLVYIKHWKFMAVGQRNFQVAYYTLGKKQDAPKPPPMSRSEIDRRRRERIKADKERLDKVNAKRRLKRMGHKLQPELEIWMRKPEDSSSGQTMQE